MGSEREPKLVLGSWDLIFLEVGEFWHVRCQHARSQELQGSEFWMPGLLS